MRQDFLKSIQAYIVRAAISPSSLRGQPKGTINATREYLSVMPLGQFGIANAKLFRSRLAAETEKLKLSLPKAARRWGTSRKTLNIVLRNAFYNRYLNERYHLGRAEGLFEVPLDSITAKRLHGFAEAKQLTKWTGVMHLNEEQNQLYQAVARRVAEKEGIEPVHLDAIWWGGEREQ